MTGPSGEAGGWPGSSQEPTAGRDGEADGRDGWVDAEESELIDADPEWALDDPGHRSVESWVDADPNGRSRQASAVEASDPPVPLLVGIVDQLEQVRSRFVDLDLRLSDVEDAVRGQIEPLTVAVGFVDAQVGGAEHRIGLRLDELDESIRAGTEPLADALAGLGRRLVAVEERLAAGLEDVIAETEKLRKRIPVRPKAPLVVDDIDLIAQRVSHAMSRDTRFVDLLVDRLVAHFEIVGDEPAVEPPPVPEPEKGRTRRRERPLRSS